jgi:hypothetical protein
MESVSAVVQAEAWGPVSRFGLFASPTDKILEERDLDICPFADMLASRLQTSILSLTGRRKLVSNCVPFGTDSSSLQLLSMEFGTWVPLWLVATAIPKSKVEIPGEENFT